MAGEVKKLKIDMLCLDIDGTLMDSRKRFPEINCRALQACERRGIRVALVSGRSFELMRDFARQLGVHPMMAACNGARIEAGEHGPTLGEFPLGRPAAERICRTLEKSGMYFNAYRRGKCYMGNPEVRAGLGARYAHHAPGTWGEAPYLYETICDRDRLWREGMEGVYKFVVMGAPYDPGFARIRAELSDMGLSVSSASRRNLEFMAPGVDKGSAVEMLCRAAGVDLRRVMAFGDQTNDLPMLRTCGWSVAMENGEDVVKAQARLIAPDHNVGGVGLTLRKYVLGDDEI